MATSTRTAPIAFVVDLVLVLVFVLIGRATHDEAPSAGVLTTLWPFAAGLVIGWLVWRGWRHPLTAVRLGIPVWLTTVAAGVLLRALSGQGVQPAFVVVAVITLGVFLVGWRLLVAVVVRRRRR